MAPSPIPAPLPPWAKVALYVGPVIGGWLYDALTHSDDSAPDIQWRRLSVKTVPTAASAVAADAAVCSWDLVNITGGNVDASWTTSDYTTCEALFDTFFNTYKGYITPGHTVSEYRWYTRQFTPVTDQYPFMDSGPPQRVTAKSYVGTASQPAPPQLAFALTEKTAWPKHWGRTYLPFMYFAGGTADRFIAASHVDPIVTAASTLYNGLATAEFFPVVPVTKVDKQSARVLLGVTQVQGDDLPDIVRRRRPRNTTYRKVLP